MITTSPTPELLDAMFRHRAQVFCDRLDWVPAQNGRERDRFDDLNPLYIISTTASGKYRGSLRLLPTTGPNMLRDVFPQLLEPGQAIESPTIWECSRLCAAPGALAELVVAVFDECVRAGLTQWVAVVDLRMRRVLRVLGVPYWIEGAPEMIGDGTAFAISVNQGGEWVERLRKKVYGRGA